jgi:hypothetical protein
MVPACYRICDFLLPIAEGHACKICKRTPGTRDEVQLDKAAMKCDSSQQLCPEDQGYKLEPKIFEFIVGRKWEAKLLHLKCQMHVKILDYCFYLLHLGP